MVDSNRVAEANATSAYNQTSKAREAQQNHVNQLLGGPGLVDPTAPFDESEDEGLRPEDSFEIQKTNPLAAPPLVKAPDVGAPVAADADDIVIPMTSSSGAVTVQNYLDGLLKSNQKSQFEETAKALGVDDVDAFEGIVEQGNALNTFAQVDSNRVLFTDNNSNEVSPDQLPAVANAKLVIKPSFQVPVDPEVKDPIEVLLNPHLAQKASQEIPGDPAEEIQRRLIEPKALQTDVAPQDLA